MPFPEDMSGDGISASIKYTMNALNPKEISEKAIGLIADRWMLVTAGTRERFNTMTANWGGMGYLWNKPVVFVFVRPNRYTFGFMEENETFTLSFLGEEYRETLKICGTLSGRDTDKVTRAGLTPEFTEQGNVTFAQADMVLECRKLYADMIRPERFLDPSPDTKWYSNGTYHKMYIAEITGAWRRE